MSLRSLTLSLSDTKKDANSIAKIQITLFKNWAKDLNRLFKGDLQTANRYIKRWSVSLIIREMQIKTINDISPHNC